MRKVIYTGVFLDLSEEEKDTIRRKWFPATMEVVHLHHMTVKFRPSGVEAAAVLAHEGKPITLKVIGQVDDGAVQVFVVEAPELEALGIEVANDIPHVTVATSQGTRPVYSNTALRNGWHEYDEDECWSLVGRLGAWRELPTMETSPVKRIRLVRNTYLKVWNFLPYTTETIRRLWESMAIPSADASEREWDWWVAVAQEHAIRGRKVTDG